MKDLYILACFGTLWLLTLMLGYHSWSSRAIYCVQGIQAKVTKFKEHLMLGGSTDMFWCPMDFELDTHSYWMNGWDVPRCLACDCNLTVKHILIECGHFAEVGQIYYNAENLQQLFQDFSVTYVFDSLCEIGHFIEYRYCWLIIACEWKYTVECF